MRWLALLTALPLVVGCAASSSSSSSSEDDVRAGSDVCKPRATLFQLTKPNAEYYQTFADDAAARAYAKSFLEGMGKKLAAAPVPPEVTAIVARDFDAYRALYPEHTEGMPGPPAVVLVDDPTTQAYAAFDASLGKLPWVFYVHTGLMANRETVENPTTVEATIAHELGHLILKNILARDAYAFYRIEGDEHGHFGFLQKNDASVKQAYETYTAATRLVGRFYAKELGAFPFKVGAQPAPTYTGYIRLLARALPQEAQAAPECATAGAANDQLQALVDARLNKSDITLELGPDAPTAARLSASWESDVTKCLRPVTGSFAAFLDQARAEALAGGTPQATVDALAPPLDDADRAIDASMPDRTAIERLLAMVHARRDAMKAIVESPTYPALRFYSDEEEADDAADRVLHHLGRPTDLILNAYDPGYRAKCTAMLAQGQSPEYGGLVDAHHGLCWRYFHLTDLRSQLDAKCSK